LCEKMSTHSAAWGLVKDMSVKSFTLNENKAMFGDRTCFTHIFISLKLSSIT